jgi:branched-chain amino acid transport system ATP-binding protein
MSVIDNLILGAYHRHRRERRENIEQDIEAVYRLFPVLEERTRQYAGTLSGGEQQMLAIGRALMSRPKLLLLDCPTLGLAPKLAKKVVKVLAELRDQGITILLIDQKLQQVIDVADRGYVVEGGGIIREDSPQALLSLEENSRFVSPKT